MRSFITLTLALLTASAASAQELTLFEQIDADPEAQQPAQPMPMGMQQQNSQPAFTLRGTSRFGDEYTTTLIGRSGEAVRVKWREGENAPVPGFDGFTIVGVNAKSVSLAHPGFDSCVSAEESGVSCTADNVAVLSMATSMPLASNGTPPNNFSQGPNFPQGANAGVFTNEQGVIGVDPVMQNAQGQQVFINPFSGQTEVV